MKKYYLAIDIGASSGRHIAGWMEEGEMKLQEVYRFPNGNKEAEGHLTWDIDALEREVRAGIEKARELLGTPVSLSIDTWGVDYVLMQGDRPLLPCYAYRDSRTEALIPEVHKILPFQELYAHTGIQFQPFNTLYQLYADKKAGRLEGVTDFLLMPEYLLYRLCGVKAHEYTNATTGGLVNAATGAFDLELVDRLCLPRQLFGRLSQPGTVIGEYKGSKVVLCPTHDTAAAVEGIPMEGEALFLSSGTWSLLGAKLPGPVTTEASRQANFTNEGGVGYIRYLKNICGLWIIQNLQKQLDMSFPAMADLARTSTYEKLFDVNDPRFSAPKDMRAEIFSALGEEVPAADLLRCVYRSLAASYHKAAEEIETLTGRSYDTLYIVGGGAKNTYLNELTAEFTGKKIIALPIEATAIGNLKIQKEADK